MTPDERAAMPFPTEHQDQAKLLGTHEEHMAYREQALLSAREEGRLAGLKEAAEIARAHCRTHLSRAYVQPVVEAIEARAKEKQP